MTRLGIWLYHEAIPALLMLVVFCVANSAAIFVQRLAL